MIKSMTGYGRGQRQAEGYDITVELKGVNHRYFEFSCRAPRGCGSIEDKLKALLQSRIARGKVELTVSQTMLGARNGNVVRANTEMAQGYLAALRELAEATGLAADISLLALANMPDVLTLERAQADEQAVLDAIYEATGDALDGFMQMREAEGARLREDLLARLDAVEQLTRAVGEQSPRTMEAYRNRLRDRMRAVLEDKNVDEARLLTEAAIFADRIAVDEETVRLKSHLAQFRAILALSEPVGRKLDFLTQEINREANTIASKAQDLATAGMVVQLKSEIEKIREQIQNIE